MVDDEPSVLMLLDTVLKRHHLPVTTAPTADAAFRLLRDNSYGCLLVDKNLPDRGGLEVIAQAQKLHPYCAVILMTAFPSYDSILEAMRMGATDYLEKPFSDVHLVAQRVARALEQQQIVFQRDTFARLLQELKGEIKRRDKALLGQRTDKELLEEIIEQRVAERTRQLKAQVDRLEGELRGAKTPLQA